MTQIRLSKKLLFNIIFSLLFIYFAFHSVLGNRGINAYFKLNSQLQKSYDKLSIMHAERVEIEHKAELLRTRDKDILEQYTKKVLGVAKPNEKVFVIKDF